MASGNDLGTAAAEPATIEAVTIHPPVATLFACTEHPAGTLQYIGDALGSVCVVQHFDGRWMRSCKGDGTRNEDWFGWQEPLLAPFAGRVVAKIGNNGMSYHPHVHIGAWKDDTAHQIRFDLNATGKLQRRGGS